MNKTFDRYAGIVFLLIGILTIIESQKISSSAYGSVVGPSAFPTGLGILLILLSIGLLYETFKNKNKEEKKESLQYKKFLIIFVGALFYVILFEVIGYILATFLFLLLAFQTIERGKWISSILIAAGFAFGIYYFYVGLLGGALPRFPLF